MDVSVGCLSAHFGNGRDPRHTRLRVLGEGRGGVRRSSVDLWERTLPRSGWEGLRPTDGVVVDSSRVRGVDDDCCYDQTRNLDPGEVGGDSVSTDLVPTRGLGFSRRDVRPVTGVLRKHFLTVYRCYKKDILCLTSIICCNEDTNTRSQTFNFIKKFKKFTR